MYIECYLMLFAFIYFCIFLLFWDDKRDIMPPFFISIFFSVAFVIPFLGAYVSIQEDECKWSRETYTVFEKVDGAYYIEYGGVDVNLNKTLQKSVPLTKVFVKAYPTKWGILVYHGSGIVDVKDVKDISENIE